MFEQLFCKHNYTFIKEINCIFISESGNSKNVPIELYECLKCGKRKVLKDLDHCYNPQALETVNMWRKHEISVEELNFD